MTLPTPDGNAPNFLSQHSHTPPPHLAVPATRIPQSTYPARPANGPFTPTPPTSFHSPSERAESPERQRAIDFAGNSWDLASGGLKTMTAKRELPRRLDRRVNDLHTNGTTSVPAQRSYAFALVILACVVAMLVGGGIVLFVMLQP